jgi:hypothetical protein
MQILMNQKYTHDFPISQSDIVNLMVGDPKKAFEAIQAHLAGISTQDKAYVMRIQRAYDKLVMVLDFVKLIFANEAAFDAAQAKAAKPTKPKAKKAK